MVWRILRSGDVTRLVSIVVCLCDGRLLLPVLVVLVSLLSVSSANADVEYYPDQSVSTFAYDQNRQETANHLNDGDRPSVLHVLGHCRFLCHATCPVAQSTLAHPSGQRPHRAASCLSRAGITPENASRPPTPRHPEQVSAVDGATLAAYPAQPHIRSSFGECRVCITKSEPRPR